MRRCKHFNRDTYCYQNPFTGETEYESAVYCNKNVPLYIWNNLVDNECGGYIECLYYEAVDIDPYWKDIFDETNRRLYNV